MGRTINEVEYSLENIYGPNKNPIKYPIGIIEKFVEFKKGGAIIGRDLNFCIEPRYDSTSCVLRTGNVQRMKLIKTLHQNQLMDEWRLRHYKDCDYTFYSSVHGTYSRLHLFLIKHSLLESVFDLNIEIITLSDHAPITMKLKIEGYQNRTTIWR